MESTSTSHSGKRKRRRNEDASSGGRFGSNRGARGGDRGHRGGRGSGRGGRARGRGSGSRGNFAGGEGRNENGRGATGRGTISGRGRGAHGGRGSGRRNHNQGRNHRGGPNSNKTNSHHNRPNNIGHNSKTPRNVQINSNDIGGSVANVVSATSSEASSLANDSDTNNDKAAARGKNTITITILPWPNPSSHYIPIEEEERILPVLIHWGQSERGMMKDQPEFRLQKIQKMLECDRNAPRQNGHDKHHGKRNNSAHQQHNDNKNDGRRQRKPNQSTCSTTRQTISLVQSLSLRRHHLKLLNPKYSMSSLRLGNEVDIRDAAAVFEVCVDAYLRGHGVEFWTEEDQRKKFERSMEGVPFHQRKQPPTPDFMMKDGHCVTLLFADDSGAKRINNSSSGDDDDPSDTTMHQPTSINWIEAKMFYGANTIPSGTPNAVGCILPKVRQYVSLYGTGAIVFMYGCGSQLAAQLLEVGVVALDGRCLDLEKVEKHQKRWCADSWGNILF